MIALSFIGKGNYKPVTYWDTKISKKYTTSYFPSALMQIYQPEKLYLVMTPEAEKDHAAKLLKECEYERISIPAGKNEDEIWEIFSIIVKAIPKDSQIIIDITHGFRSQPMIILSMANFLRSVKNVQINKIIYGAYEARDENDVAPIFDLTSFVHLIDWTFAVDTFLKYGHATILKELLSTLQKKLKVEQDHISSVKNFGDLVYNMTQTLSFIRPEELSRLSKQLEFKIENVKNEFAKVPETKPLEYLLNKIPKSFSNLALKVDEDLFSDAGFRMQAHMIHFYLETQQYVQAITLAREVVVSVICKKEKLRTISRMEREQAETLLNEWAEHLKKGIKLEDMPTKVATLWTKIRDKRNDINHAGMREGSSHATQLQSSVKEICTELIQFIHHAH